MDDDGSLDSDRMEHKVDSSMGQYHSAYEVYEEKLQQAQQEVKNLKEKIDEIRQKHFHCMRTYFKDNNYYNSLQSRANGVTRLESHSNSHTSEAGHNESIHTNTGNGNESNGNSNGHSNPNNGRIPESRQAAEERLKRELNMRPKIRLQGHGNKVYAIDWHQNNNELISAARDAKCMIWNVETGYRKTAFNLDTEFTMDCKYSPDCSIVACGGLDDTCSIYKLTDKEGNDMHGFKDISPIAKLQEHGGYISSIAFVDNNRVLTASGDQTLILWDIKEGNVIDIYGSHWADVMSVSVKPDDRNVFVSGSTDYTCRVWDTRLQNNSNPRKLSQEEAARNNHKNNRGNNSNSSNNNNNNNSSNNNNGGNNENEYFVQMSQSGQFDSEYRRRNLEANPCVTHIYSMNSETDVNYVKWFPNGYCFAAGNEDGVIKLYDIRSNHCLNEFSFQESLGYVNPMHPQSISNPNVTSQHRHLLDKPAMYGLYNQGKDNLSGRSNDGTTTTISDEDSRDRLKKSNHNIENTTELSHLQDMIEKYDTDFEGVACLDFSSSGQYLFASYNGTSAILVWDVITGQIVERMQEHNYHIPKVSMSPDGKLLAASCWDKTNYIYERK